jgi:cytoskeletal protein CcmA (bactofilin family)
VCTTDAVPLIDEDRIRVRDDGMTDVEVVGAGRTLSMVEGNLKIKDAQIECDAPDGILKVSGSTTFKGDCTLNCILETESLEGRGTALLQGLVARGSVEVARGDLLVKGDATADRIEVDRRMSVSGDLTCAQAEVGGILDARGSVRAERIDVGGSLSVDSAEIGKATVGGKIGFVTRIKGDRITVGGKLEGDGDLEVERIDVGGTVKIGGKAVIGKIDVGGTVVIGGGEIKEDMDVGGTLKSTRPLIFNSIDVGGKVSLAGGEGQEVDVGGVLTSTGHLTVQNIEVGGKVHVDGNLEGTDADVGGFIDVSGNLEMSGKVRVGGKISIGETAKALSIRVGGEVLARRVEAEQDIETHTLRTESGARAERIEISKNGRARGPLVGEVVRVGQKASVEDVYAQSIQMEKNSTAGNLYGTTIHVRSGVAVGGEVLYTEELKTEGRASFANPPTKVEELPQPPE